MAVSLRRGSGALKGAASAARAGSADLALEDHLTVAALEHGGALGVEAMDEDALSAAHAVLAHAQHVEGLLLAGSEGGVEGPGGLGALLHGVSGLGHAVETLQGGRRRALGPFHLVAVGLVALFLFDDLTLDLDLRRRRLDKGLQGAVLVRTQLQNVAQALGALFRIRRAAVAHHHHVHAGTRHGHHALYGHGRQRRQRRQGRFGRRGRRRGGGRSRDLRESRAGDQGGEGGAGDGQPRRGFTHGCELPVVVRAWSLATRLWRENVRVHEQFYRFAPSR
ncbi:hypothetical protein CC_3671 [Caulobacter vibrioides CB15]|uniref:Uncharacterized protein n=1 Tax=Caulobacter vibrioides (strain ATCC 19089 / CIP 103742 / CB 15) TaxID=190650 RepID=Q9A295_CAUVC|nr:hypothetical protein CC_3671 [Caulobacter vibrioides CB15]